MGCFVALECEATSEAEALQGVEAAWEAITRVMQRMNPAAPGSDLARLNGATPGEELALDPWTTQVLRLSRRLCRATDGLFDPALPGHGSMRSLVDLGESRWRLREAVQLDFGGIAKGFAVDRAVQAMRAQGARAGLVNAGGDLRCFGPRWRTFQLQRGGLATQSVWLRAGALAVSEAGAAGTGGIVPPSADAPPAHRGFYLGNTFEGSPARREPQLPIVAVLAHDCARADAMTKVFLMAPRPRHALLAHRCGVRLCEAAPAAPTAPAAPAALQPGRTWPEPRTTYL
jgi:FAD:protein FMN transferase